MPFKGLLALGLMLFLGALTSAAGGTGATAGHDGGAAAAAPLPPPLAPDDQAILRPEETRFLANVRQLTFGPPPDAPRTRRLPTMPKPTGRRTAQN
jgi:hypothetical protein